MLTKLERYIDQLGELNNKLIVLAGPRNSGKTKLLRELGASTQVLVVTHLPQVAGQGHQHLFVSKQSDGSSTETRMLPLSPQGRLDELARLLGGDQITSNTLANARELLCAGP